MDIKKFNSGQFVQQFKYKSFSPTSINIDWELTDLELISLLSISSNKLGELNAYSQLIPDIDFFIKMHIRLEASQSSKIEGTQTNIEDILQKIENINPEKRDDWQEVQNYISSMNYAIEKLNKLPISTRLIKETHKILMNSVRGQNKQPGEYRKSQNWIGGASLIDATFIPPHHKEINNLMSDLEKFINNVNSKLPSLIKAGIIHYQFETIHPFLDGNGRIGRLLIILYLISDGLLSVPCLYLSDFFEKNRQLYYDNLNNVRENNELTQWLKFFLTGILLSSESGINTFKEIIELKHKVDNKIDTLGRRIKPARLLLNYLYSQPLVIPNDVAHELNINISSAIRLIDEFVKLEILLETTGYKRNRIFVFNEYLKIFNR